MALGDSYATLTKLKDRVGLEDDLDDAKLTTALSVASRGIEGCTHRQFNDAGSATSRLYYPASYRRTEVDDFSTTTGLVIEVDTSGTGSSWTAWSSSYYELQPLNGIVGGVPGWPYWKIKTVQQYFPMCSQRASLRVTARWGWAAVPSPVEEACLILAEEIFKLKDLPFGAGGYGEFGRIRARENPHVWLRIQQYVLDPVMVA